ncbi:MAG: 4-hydroxythreonine-4-phosphate dehydrogenase PdxA [Candidatus Zixiibacteriota bacterium]
MHSKPIIGITMGDPAGIGPEVVVKAVTEKRVRQVCHPLIFGSYQVIRSAARKYLKGTRVGRIAWPEDVRNSKEDISVLTSTSLDYRGVRIGTITRLSGKMAADSVFSATQFAVSGQIDALVTAPLSKKGLQLAGYDFRGHTELLAYLMATREYAMMFVSSDYKVALVTTHLPLSEVSGTLTKRLILGKLAVTQRTLERWFGIKRPSIGVCALNPHCGEEGIFGSEERRLIIPAIRSARKMGIRAVGPYSADTIFSPGISKGFDCILAMYHDQGLIPLKIRGLGESVNVTIGLPIIRTSPDFGTALDIAGQGMADPRGMTNAILLSCQIAKKVKSNPSFFHHASNA